MLSGYAMGLWFGFGFTHCLAYIFHVACGLSPHSRSCYVYVFSIYLTFEFPSCIIEDHDYRIDIC